MPKIAGILGSDPRGFHWAKSPPPIFLILTGSILLSACGEADYDPRGLDRNETLVSISATGEAESQPDTARFQAGVTSFGASARAASQANADTVRDVLAALRTAGVSFDDIQTRALNVGRIEYGDREGQYQASNVVEVTVRRIEAAGEAVTAATEAGANVMSGPSLSMDDPEASVNTAYADAFRAARSRAEAYADAADMKITRVLSIRDAGGYQGDRTLPYAVPAAPPPPPMVSAPRPESGAPFMSGTTTSGVSIQVDFALEPV